MASVKGTLSKFLFTLVVVLLLTQNIILSASSEKGYI